MSLAIVSLCLYQVHLFHIISTRLILQPLVLPSVEYQLEPVQRLKVSKTHISATMIIPTIFTCCSREHFFSLTALYAVILLSNSLILENFDLKNFCSPYGMDMVYDVPGRLFQKRVTKNSNAILIALTSVQSCSIRQYDGLRSVFVRSRPQT